MVVRQEMEAALICVSTPPSVLSAAVTMATSSPMTSRPVWVSWANGRKEAATANLEQLSQYSTVSAKYFVFLLKI